MTAVPTDREWLLERYLLGELPPPERRRLERELRDDPGLRAELERLRRSGQRILDDYPAERMVPEILKRAERAAAPAAPRPRLRLAWLAAPALVAAMLLLVVLPPLLRRQPPGRALPGNDAYVGLTGGGAASAAPGLRIYRRHGDAIAVLGDGEWAEAGDLLQLAYVPGGQAYGVILSIDGAGAVTLHFPEKPNGDTALGKGRRVLLPRAYELDRAPGFERFFFVSGGEAVPTATVMEQARALAADRGRAMSGQLELPARFRQASLLLRKRGTP